MVDGINFLKNDLIKGTIFAIAAACIMLPHGYTMEHKNCYVNRYYTFDNLNRAENRESKYIPVEFQKENVALSKKIDALKKEIELRKQNKIIDVSVTAYDLSEACCEKSIDDKAYGITASGISVKGKTLEQARVIAVDPKMIPLGSKVRLTFKDPKFSKYNGVYTAADIGGAIQGNKIDLFFGDYGSNEPDRETIEFGRREATVELL